jgi:hypothetical protein
LSERAETSDKNTRNVAYSPRLVTRTTRQLE